MNVSVEIKGDEALLQGLDQFARQLGPEVRAVVRESARAVELDAKRQVEQQGAVDRGQTRQLIGTSFADEGLTARVEARAGQSLFVEKGRRPGAKFPPPEPIREWARRKGLTRSLETRRRGAVRRGRGTAAAALERQIREITFLVSRAISRRGIRPRPFMEPAGEAERPRFVARLQALLDRMTAAVGRR